MQTYYWTKGTALTRAVIDQNNYDKLPPALQADFAKHDKYCAVAPTHTAVESNGRWYLTDGKKPIDI